jgi:hypothetical protein
LQQGFYMEDQNYIPNKKTKKHYKIL